MRASSLEGEIMAEKTLAQFADEHYKWIEFVGWAGNRTQIENLGRIGSEIGELINECRGEDALSENFDEELADVILASITAIKESQYPDAFEDQEIGIIAKRCYESDYYPELEVRAFPTIFGAVSYGFVVIGNAINEHNRRGNQKIAVHRIHEIINYFLAVARKADINVNDAMIEKMAKNQIKGNRGRKK